MGEQTGDLLRDTIFANLFSIVFSFLGGGGGDEVYKECCNWLLCHLVFPSVFSLKRLFILEKVDLDLNAMFCIEVISI